MAPPVVQHLNNEPVLNDLCGFVHDFAERAVDGRLVHIPVAPRELAAEVGQEHAVRRLAQLARDTRPDLVFVQAPHTIPTNCSDVHRVVDAAGRPPVVYWEVDAWGGRKRLPESTRAWLSVADRVFSIALGPQHGLLRAHTRAPISYVPHVLPNSCARTRRSCTRPLLRGLAIHTIAGTAPCLAGSSSLARLLPTSPSALKSPRSRSLANAASSFVPLRRST